MATAANRQQGWIWVGSDEREIFLKVEGRATHVVGPALKRCLLELEARGMRAFRLDLSACALMDSTFLGVLASTCLRLRDQPGSRFVLEAVSGRNLEQLRTLGIAHLFEVRSESSTAPPVLHPLPLQAESTDSWAEVIGEAHDALARADASNATRFQDVIELLVEQRR
jgi:anti-anti-sigma regulatory factor